MATKEQTYYDYLEMGEPLVGSGSTMGKRKSWLAAIGSMLLLGGASVAYTTENHNAAFNWRFWESEHHDKPSSMTLQALQATPSNALVALDNNSDALLADQTVTISGNRVVITLPSVLKDGCIAIATVSVAVEWRNRPPREVKISAPTIRFGQTTFQFDVNVPSSLDQRVACRTVTGSNPGGTGSIVAVPITFTYPSEPVPPPAQTQPVQRELASSSRCNAWGDPHLTTLDGVPFDFMATGVFRYVESRNFQIQVFQEKCPPPRTDAAAPACYRAFSLSFADSILRFYLEGNKIQIAKGSESTRWFQVYRFGGNTDGFRVFFTADQTSYVDVTMGIWVQNYGYMNIAFQASPFFKDPSIQGLMGNWNGNGADDVRDEARLAAAHGFPMNNNLFTCDGDDCSRFVKPARNDDEVALTLEVPTPELRQGFILVDPATIVKRTYTPVLNKVMAMARDLTAQDAPAADVTKRALKLCDQVISSLKTCDKYVPNKSFYIYNICLEDSVLVNDLSVVDQTKIAYLRECRRELEAQVLGAAGNAAKLKELEADRAELEFGDLSKCPADCNGRGDCLAAGCHCKAGWTGAKCEIKV